SKGELRREAERGKSGSLLLSDVRQFEIKSVDDGQAVQVVIVVQQSRLGSPNPLRRSVELTLSGTPLEVLP
ncbi:MAG: hypothetical protein ABI579_07570, partial [Candidatus Sumerlaeota bacterium]